MVTDYRNCVTLLPTTHGVKLLIARVSELVLELVISSWIELWFELILGSTTLFSIKETLDIACFGSSLLFPHANIIMLKKTVMTLNIVS